MEALGTFAMYLAIAAFAGLAGWAAYVDYTRYIIPNRICLAIAALYPLYVIAAPHAVDVFQASKTRASLKGQRYQSWFASLPAANR